MIIPIFLNIQFSKLWSAVIFRNILIIFFNVLNFFLILSRISEIFQAIFRHFKICYHFRSLIIFSFVFSEHITQFLKFLELQDISRQFFLLLLCEGSKTELPDMTAERKFLRMILDPGQHLRPFAPQPIQIRIG